MSRSDVAFDASVCLSDLAMLAFVLRVKDGMPQLLHVAGDSMLSLSCAPQTLQTSWLATCVHPADAGLYLPDYASLQAQARQESLFRVRSAAGAYRWLRQNCALHGPGQPQDYLLTGTLSDGEELHQLQQSARRFREFTKLSSDWYWEQDEQFRFTYFSKEFEEITGISLTGILGKTRWAGLGLSDSAGVDWEGHEQLLLEHKPFRNFEYPSRIHPERSIWFRVSGYPKFDEDGRFSGYIGIASEIGGYKKIQEELKRVNAEQRALIEQLNQTQQQMLQSEKMAALGSLVAGVAHELNTPIGNCLMTASTQQDETEIMVGKVAGQAVRRSDLNSYISQTQQASTLIMRNLRAAADLVSSFKQVAVDRASEQRRCFNLAQASQEIVATIMNQIRKGAHSLTLDISPDIEMDSYPGPLGQVIINLINNALLHGFDGRRGGHICLSASLIDEQHVRLVLHDDGAGIPALHMARIFEPFFTTKLGQGGSGLGLHISYNIVNSVLGGQIHVTSSPESGTSFTLDLPLCPVRPQEEG